MPFIRSVYNIFMRRSSAYALTIFVGAVFFERLLDNGIDNYWDRRNQGVSF